MVKLTVCTRQLALIYSKLARREMFVVEPVAELKLKLDKLEATASLASI